MDTIIKINLFVESIIRFICAGLLGLFTVVISAQIIFRGLCGYSFAWSVDVALIAFIWSVMLGAVIALRKRTHFNIALMPEKWKKVNAVLDIVCDLIIFVVLSVLVVRGIEFTIMGKLMFFSYINVSQATLMASIPLSAGLMVIINLENFMIDISKLRNIKVVKSADNKVGE